MSRILVVDPGMATTVQDLGRPGWQRHGVTPGGAVDAPALRLANLLAGNAEGAAGLEITLAGPTLRFAADAVIALTGADCGAAVDGQRAPGWRPLRLAAGATLAIGAARTGCRAYLAVAGGIAVPRVLGGRGTHTAAAFGGLDGRALRSGDTLKCGPASAWAKRLAASLAAPGPMAAAHWEVSAEARPPYGASPTVRVMRGPQWAWFGRAAQERLLDEALTATAKSDRMGLRLEPTDATRTALAEGMRPDMLSEGVSTGAVQVTPDGRLIVLLADRQTIGGYPKVAHVATVDLPLLAQVRPGGTIRFHEVSVDEAQELWFANEQRLATVRHGIALHAS